MGNVVRKYGGYVAFALAMLALFTWVRMPSDAFRTLVLKVVSKSLPGALVRLEAAEPAFPLGMALTGLSVHTEGGRGVRIEAGTVAVHSELTALLTGRLALQVRAEMMGGQIDGDVAFKNRFSTGGPVRADLRFGGINAADSPWLATLLGRQVQGRVDGRLLFEGLPGPWTAGSGQLELAIVNGLISMQAPLFGLEQLTFTRMAGSFTLDNGTLRVKRLEVAGDHIQGDFQGSVRLEQDLARSSLSLRGDVSLPASGAERIAVAVGGTIGSPVVTPL